jgi:hypothetical protein
MAGRSRGFKWGSIVLALLLGTGLVALAGSMMLPSTKRARIDWDEVRRLQPEDVARSAATTAPATGPTTEPTTVPTDSSVTPSVVPAPQD